MNDIRSLVKNTFIYSIGNLGSKILGFLLIPLYSFYLSKGELGYYDIIITTLTLLIPLASIQMTEAVYRWLLDVIPENENFNDQLTAVITNSSLVLFLGLVISFVLTYIFHVYFSFKYWGLFELLVLTSTCLQYFQQIARGLKDSRTYSASGILNTFLIVASNIIFLVIYKQQVAGLILATIIANTISILFLWFVTKPFRYFKLSSFSLQLSKDLLNYSWPLIPNAISWWMITLANRYIVVTFLGSEQNGLFALSNRFPAIIIIFNSFFMLAFQDHVITSQTSLKKSYNSFFDAYLRLELCLVLFLISISRLLVLNFVDVKFYESWKFMPLLYVGVAFSAFAAFLGTGYIGARQTREIFYTTILGGIINLIISFSLISKIGLFAPALGTLFGFATIWMVRSKLLSSGFEIEINIYTFSILIAAIAIFCFVSSFENKSFDSILIITSLVIGYVTNRKLISKITTIVSDIFVKQKYSFLSKNKLKL